MSSPLPAPVAQPPSLPSESLASVLAATTLSDSVNALEATTDAQAKDLAEEAEAGPSQPRMSAIDKWLKPNGPPRGVTFGARKLQDDDDVYANNAWDHAELPDDFEERAEEIMEVHRASPVPENLVEEYNAKPNKYWNKFYSNHQDAFFKDRKWLPLEFGEMTSCIEADAGPKVILEVGCGAGNTVFPLLAHNENPDLVIYATDYSATAVNVVKSSEMYPRAPHGLGVLHASVWDITSKSDPSSVSEGVTYSLPEGIEPNSVDVLSVIYVLSALHPTEWEQAIHNLYTALKPGGLLCVRDYGRHDLAQLRITKSRLLDVPHLYIRGDGTRVYFFEKEQLGGLLTAQPRGGAEGSSMFTIDQLDEDRRLLVNRKERKKMYRIWLQIKARKI